MKIGINARLESVLEEQKGRLSIAAGFPFAGNNPICLE